MSTPARFSDEQYKNWLKCSMSLINMKEALHDYTDNEVKQLHGDITQKVSRIPCASSTGNQCGSCSSKNIRLTGNPGNWSIKCNNNICDKWLQQILAHHDNRHNSSINWKNADVRLWPFNYYQVAKIFMPKGQHKTVKMPNDLDAPAILSLFKYCNWFRKDLPNKQIMSDLIDFRNKVLHSGDLKVSDSDKDSKIDLMIQLLKDLKIHGDVISDLEKLKKEDIDISFRANEIRLLQEMVSGLVSYINTVKEDMATMKDSVSDLSENMEKVRDRTMETIGKVDAVNTDMEGIRKSLEGHRDIYNKIVLFFDKNPDIHEFTEKLQTIDRDYKVMLNRFTRLETKVQTLNERVSSLEKYREETNIEIKGIKEKMEGLDVRLAASEEQRKHEKETTRKKRPETEGLRQLKIQTEDRLRTLRQLKYIPTIQAEKAKKLLEENGCIVIKGNPGEGKTTMSLHLIDNEQYEDKRVVLHSADDWKTVDLKHVDIVVLEDVFGKYDFDHGLLETWMVHLSTIQEHVDGRMLRVIVTSRVDVLTKAKDRLKSLRLFSDDFSLTLSSKDLTRSEKKDILNRELHRCERNMTEDDKETCIHNFSGLIGFPQCCLLFASNNQLFERGSTFFKAPREFFHENITDFKDTKLLALAFLFCNGKIFEENLSSDTMPESSKMLLSDLASKLKISQNFASIELLRDVYDNFGELYVMKSMSYDISLSPYVQKPSIMFTHPTVTEAVGHVLGKHCCEMVVTYGAAEYLYQRTYTAEAADETSENVFLPVYVYERLAKRMVDDVVNRRFFVSSVVKHSALKRPDFIKKLKDELNKGNVLKEFCIADRKDKFFMARKVEFQSHALSEGVCDTFMQYILQGDKDVVIVYSELLEMLACVHNDNISDCWKCEEKQNLLELALYYHHFEIANKLIAKKARYTDVSLCNAARHGDLKKVQTITESLKKNRVFNPESKKAKYALYRAYVSGNQSLIEFLLKEEIILDSWCIVNAVKHGDVNVLTKVVEHLKLYKWNPKCDDASKALETAICKQRDEVYDLLVQEGVSLKMENLTDLITFYNISLENVKKVIQHLKDTDNWYPRCDDASEALEAAISEQRDDVYDLLVQEGVSLKMKNLQNIIKIVYEISLEAVQKFIQHLKDTDNWNPKCDDASKALEAAISEQRDDVYDLLVQEKVSLKMENLLSIIMGVDEISLESVQKVIKHLKDTNNWYPKCDDASEVLLFACNQERYNVMDLLIQEGVLLNEESS